MSDLVGLATCLELGPLAAGDLLDLLAARGVDPQAARSAVARAGGNPFLAIVAAMATGVDSVPSDGLDLIAQRFLAQSPDLVQILGVAALIGRVIDVSLLPRLADRSPKDVHRALDVAVESGILCEPGATLAFTHDLVLEAARATVGTQRATRLHAELADVYAARHDHPREAAHLLAGFAALDPAAAAQRLNAVCAQLTARGAFEDSYAVATRFVEAVERDPRCGSRDTAVALICALEAGALCPTDIDLELELSARAQSAARDAGDAELFARVALLRGEVGVVGHPDQTIIALLDEAISRLDSGDSALRARLEAMRMFRQVVFEASETVTLDGIDQLTAKARRSGDEAALAEVIITTSYTLIARSEIDRPQQLLDEVRSLLPNLDARAAARARTSLDRIDAGIALQLGDRTRFEQRRHDIEAWSERWNRVVLHKVALMWASLSAALDGDPAGSESAAFELLAADRTDANFVHSAGVLIASSHRWRGTTAHIARRSTTARRREPVAQPGVIARRDAHRARRRAR